jgi:hypothetical protein
MPRLAGFPVKADSRAKLRLRCESGWVLGSKGCNGSKAVCRERLQSTQSCLSRGKLKANNCPPENQAFNQASMIIPEKVVCTGPVRKADPTQSH